MTSNEYRAHPIGSLRRAFFRGRYAALAGQELNENPYRNVLVTKKARRGSWSEAFTAAWAVGWHDATPDSSPTEMAAAIADEGVSS